MLMASPSATVPSGDKQHDEEAFSYALELAISLVLPMSLHAATQLGIFEIISKAGPHAKLSPAEIAVQLPTSNPGAPMLLDRLLKFLATYKVVEYSVVPDGTGGVKMLYSLTAASKFFVRDKNGCSLAPLMDLTHEKCELESWSKLKDAVLEGRVPFEMAHGSNVFEYSSKDRRFSQVFNNAMHNHTTIVMKRILEAYHGFENVSVLVDVAGGLGINLSLIIAKYPAIKGINFDLPHVIQDAPAYPGIEHAAGDMFQSIPKGDSIFLKWILHNWTDDQCIKLLKICYDAIPSDGKVIVAEDVLPSVPETNSAAKATFATDVMMMTISSGGTKRTKQEFMALATQSGFKDISLINIIPTFCIMEFFK